MTPQDGDPERVPKPPRDGLHAAEPRSVRAARVVDLGTREYGEVWALPARAGERATEGRNSRHAALRRAPPRHHAGRSAHHENVIATDGIPIFEIERGGDVTYHGPGQLVGYPIFLLRDDERDLHVYLRNLEEALIRALARFDLASERRPAGPASGPPGGVRKLASIGVAVKRWVTMHGFALNVSTDLGALRRHQPLRPRRGGDGLDVRRARAPRLARRGEGRGPRHLRRGVRPPDRLNNRL